MKFRRNIGMAISIIGAICLFVGIVYPIVTEKMNIFDIVMLSVGIVCEGLAMYLIRCPSIARIMYERKNMRLPLPQEIDYGEEIESVRQNYSAETKPLKNALPREVPYAAEYFDKSVWVDGEICYAALVQANDKLFTNSRKNAVLPAVAVYSTDAYYDRHPQELLQIAQDLYADKPNNILSYEHNYKDHILLQGDFGGREVYLTTLMLYRDHFPACHLVDGLFPIIVKRGCTASYMVNSKYWSDSLKADYLHSSFFARKLLEQNNEN